MPLTPDAAVTDLGLSLGQSGRRRGGTGTAPEMLALLDGGRS